MEGHSYHEGEELTFVITRRAGWAVEVKPACLAVTHTTHSRVHLQRIMGMKKRNCYHFHSSYVDWSDFICIFHNLCKYKWIDKNISYNKYERHTLRCSFQFTCFVSFYFLPLFVSSFHHFNQSYSISFHSIFMCFFCSFISFNFNYIPFLSVSFHSIWLISVHIMPLRPLFIIFNFTSINSHFRL